MNRTPSMDDKATPSPPEREDWQYQADKLIGANSPPWPSDDERRAALAAGVPQRVHKLEDGEFACTHVGWSFDKDGRRCPYCGTVITDPGD